MGIRAAISLEQPEGLTLNAPKKRPYEYSMIREKLDQQASLRGLKVQAEQLKEKLQSKILENPRAAQKAALILSLWIEGKTKVKKKAA
jgi:hypothetical protein